MQIIMKKPGPMHMLICRENSNGAVGMRRGQGCAWSGCAMLEKGCRLGSGFFDSDRFSI